MNKARTSLVSVNSIVLLVAVLIGIVFLVYSSVKDSQSIIPIGYDYYTGSGLLNEDNTKATYSYGYFISNPPPAFHLCQDPRMEEIIDFVGPVHPSSYNDLPCLAENVILNQRFPAYDIEIIPLAAQTNSPCNPFNIQSLTPVYEDLGTECWVKAGATSGCQKAEVQCHFKGKVYALDSSGERAAGVFGLVSQLKAKVDIQKEGIECSIGETKCEGENHYTCSSLNQWVNEGQVAGQCGVVEPEPSPEPEPELIGNIWAQVGVGLAIVLILGVIGFMVYLGRKRR